MANKIYGMPKGYRRVWGQNGVYLSKAGAPPIRPVSRELGRVDWVMAIIAAFLAFPACGIAFAILQAMADVLK